MRLTIKQMKASRLIIIKISFLLISCSPIGKKVYYYIPKNVENTFAIVFSKKEGIPLEIDSNGNLIYRIPANGVLVVNEDKEPDVMISKLFYVNAKYDTIESIRNLKYDEYHGLSIKKDLTYELNSYYRETENIKIKIFIISKDVSVQGQKKSYDIANNLENKLLKQYNSTQ